MDRPHPLKIAIAGAGVAGLSAAAFLARAGHDVTVYDQFHEPRPVGSGLMIQPAGLAVLAELGLADTTRAAASPIARIYGRTLAGRDVLDVSYRDLSSGIAGLAIQRAALFDMLLNAAMAAGAKLTPDTCVTGVAQTGSAALLETQEGTLGPFDLILDCLGAYSILCPRPTNPLKYGALWALLDWPEQSALALDRLEQRYARAAKMAGILPVGPVPDGKMKLTFFWSLRAQDHQAWRATALDAWRQEVIDLWPATAPVVAQITSHDDLVFAQYTHHTVRRPGRDRVAHLGDSHHATSPQLGQGANTALLDAAALARALGAHPDPILATRAYASSRWRHVAVYQSLSWLFTPLYQSDSTLLPWIRDWVAAPASRLPMVPRLLAKLIAGELVAPIRGRRKID